MKTEAMTRYEPARAEIEDIILLLKQLNHPKRNTGDLKKMSQNELTELHDKLMAELLLANEIYCGGVKLILTKIK